MNARKQEHGQSPFYNQTFISKKPIDRKQQIKPTTIPKKQQLQWYVSCIKCRSNNSFDEKYYLFVWVYFRVEIISELSGKVRPRNFHRLN